MGYLQMGLAAGAAVILVLWYDASSVVDNYSVAGLLIALSCIVALGLWVNRSPRRP